MNTNTLLVDTFKLIWNNYAPMTTIVPLPPPLPYMHSTAGATPNFPITQRESTEEFSEAALIAAIAEWIEELEQEQLAREEKARTVVPITLPEPRTSKTKVTRVVETINSYSTKLFSYFSFEYMKNIFS